MNACFLNHQQCHEHPNITGIVSFPRPRVSSRIALESNIAGLKKVLLSDSCCRLPWKCLMKRDPKWLPRNPAPVKVGGLSHCLQSFMHPRFGISSQIVGGFLPPWKNMCKSNWIISPRDRGEHKESLKLSSRLWCSNCFQAYMLFLPDTNSHLQPFRP